MSNLNVQGFGLFGISHRYRLMDNWRTRTSKPRRESSMKDDRFTGWRKSSYSGDGNSCVELAVTRPESRDGTGPVVGVRDT